MYIDDVSCNCLVGNRIAFIKNDKKQIKPVSQPAGGNKTYVPTHYNRAETITTKDVNTEGKKDNNRIIRKKLQKRRVGAGIKEKGQDLRCL